MLVGSTAVTAINPPTVQMMRHVGHHAGHAAVIESGLVVAAQAALGKRLALPLRQRIRPAIPAPEWWTAQQQRVKRIITATIATPTP